MESMPKFITHSTYKFSLKLAQNKDKGSCVDAHTHHNMSPSAQQRMFNVYMYVQATHVCGSIHADVQVLLRVTIGFLPHLHVDA